MSLKNFIYIIYFTLFILAFLPSIKSDCPISNCSLCNTTIQPPDCLSCISSTYLFNNQCLNCEISPYNCTLCNQTLNSSFYPYLSQCLNCSECFSSCSFDFNCQICSSQGQCFFCSKGFFLDTTFSCQICSDQCKECYGPDHNNCLSCLDGFFLSEGSCFACNQTCATCSNSSNQCLSCFSGGVLTSGSQCQYTCDDSCGECFGIGSHQCLSCKDNNTVLIQNTCYEIGCNENCQNCSYYEDSYANNYSFCAECKTGFYFLSSCFPCANSCKTCNGSSASECLTCNDGFYQNKKNGQCIQCYYLCSQCYGGQIGSCSGCIDGYYLMESVCLACNNSCKTCFGPNENHCLSCYEGTEYQSLNNTCYGGVKNSTSRANNQEESGGINIKALIISLSVIFGILVITIIILAIFFVKSRTKVKELKYLNQEILSKKSSVKLEGTPSENIPSHHNFVEIKNNVKKDGENGKTPLEHHEDHELIGNDDRFENILEKNCKEIEKIYENDN